MATRRSLTSLQAMVGQELGTSDWFEITQNDIDAFAKVTQDFASIHISPEHAAKTPMGTTIAHGLFTLSLGPKFLYEIVEVQGHSWGLKYGYDVVRFTAPVPVGSRLRMTMRLLTADSTEAGMRFRFEEKFQIEGQDKPACVAEAIGMYFF